MPELTPGEILFIGLGKSPVLWYRMALPAQHMGADWIGIQGDPPRPKLLTGLVRGATALPSYDDYKVIVLQQVRGMRWMRLIRDLQDRGITVLYEVDDFLHGVGDQDDHDFRSFYTKDVLKGLELCMRQCDGMIVSTAYLAERYARLNRNVWVCENGIDTARYRVSKPARDTINVGWSGATGHTRTIAPWFAGVATVMEANENVCFVSVGQPHFAAPFKQMFGEHRAIGIPFTMIENYPGAMSMIDIAIAPAGKSPWWLGKSDLRWLEAGALGIPIIADPALYPKITDGVDGFHASSPDQALQVLRRLVDDEEERTRVGDSARAYVGEHRDIAIACRRWFDVAQEAVALPGRSSLRS